MKPLQPFVQGDMAALHNRLHSDREILAAGRLCTTEDTGAFRLISVSNYAAMGTNRTIRPQDAFEKLASRGVILEMRGGENCFHCVTCFDEEIYITRYVVSTI